MRLPGLSPAVLSLLAWVAVAPTAAADIASPPGPFEFSRRAWGWLILAVVALAFAAWIWTNHRRKVALERADAAGRKGGADAD